jgi:hypothetical protein
MPRRRLAVISQAGRWVAAPVPPPHPPGYTWPELVAAEIARRELVAVLTAWLNALRVA